MSVTISMTESEYDSLRESLDYIQEKAETQHTFGISSVIGKYEKAKDLQDEINGELNVIKQMHPYKRYQEALSQARQVVAQKRKRKYAEV